MTHSTSEPTMTLPLTLHHIHAGIRELIELTELTGGEITPDIERRLEALECAKSEKVLSLGKYLHGLRLTSEIVKAEETRLKEKRASIDARIERIQDYLIHFMSGATFSDGAFTIGVRKSQAVEIVSEKDLPDIYWRTKIERTPDKAAIKEDLKCGATIPGAELVTRDNIAIK